MRAVSSSPQERPCPAPCAKRLLAGSAARCSLRDFSSDRDGRRWITPVLHTTGQALRATRRSSRLLGTGPTRQTGCRGQDKTRPRSYSRLPGVPFLFPIFKQARGTGVWVVGEELVKDEGGNKGQDTLSCLMSPQNRRVLLPPGRVLAACLLFPDELIFLPL